MMPMMVIKRTMKMRMVTTIVIVCKMDSVLSYVYISVIGFQFRITSVIYRQSWSGTDLFSTN